ncbi:caspase family protein [Streptomyces sp. NPDC002553]|uniref:HD domain-containing protein n=1 Tax=Streptomyces sp. NPDC002553 TaxID=3154417 RepID=UPI00331789EB
MGSRQALIIAVPQCELIDRFADLTNAVRHDVELMTAALRSSGYSVEHLGVTPDEPALRSRIRSAISRVCATAPEDGTVLIHFTGHGMTVDGADHLVPADVQLTWATDPPQVAPDTLVALDLAELLRGCRAGTVLLTVDACRDTAGSDTPSQGGAATTFPALRDQVAVVFGCGPGQTCGSDEERGSHFTRALADALHSDTGPRTVADVIAHTTRRTAEFARAARHAQTPTVHYAPSGPDAVLQVELCAGRKLHEEWATAVHDPELWAAVPSDDARRARLQRALAELANTCAHWRASALADCPDPWADDDYPLRVLVHGLRPLLAPSRTQGGPLLDAAELAALLAAPFVREAVHAMGVKETTAVHPFRLDPETGRLGREPERVDLEHTFAAHSLLWRKGRELAGRDREEDARAVAAWLLNRHVNAKEQLWDVYAPQLLSPLAEALLGPGTARGRRDELVDELVRVCRCLALVPSEPYQGERTTAETQRRVDDIVRSDGATERWRPRELSWLIGVAGLLGGDLRQLPGVLVDNIGITDGLTPGDAVASVRELRWARDRLSGTLDLDLPCPHPAVHAALETLVAWSDEAVQNIRRHLGTAEPAALLAHLPERITCRRLRPRYDGAGKGDAYSLPLMRFGLAEDEMRELLMGTQLYGDPALALRELYQNALDACRYRQARLRYGKAAGNVPYSWEGGIVFRQGTDDDGRPYVECEDNGVGMDRQALRGTFSRAGRRFEQSREYRREQSRWRRADPSLRIYPNSRFGVGVFSYFMLADEISVWTRATDEYGRADPAGGLRVDVASTGSLFRIRRSEEAQPTGGTRVRLYLQQDDIDVAEELGRRVWRSEFGMRVERDGGVPRAWEKGTLYYLGDATRPRPAGQDAWWVEGKGCLLADGILVESASMDTVRDATARAWLHAGGRTLPVGEDRTDQRDSGGHPFGYVIDLYATHAPDISTDRTRILAYDAEWVEERIRQAAENFEPPEWLTLEWLWAFAGVHPDAAALVTERLLALGAQVTSRTGWNWSAVFDFRRVGCFPPDSLMVRLGEYSSGRTPGTLPDDCGIVSWRAAVLRDADVELRVERRESLALPDTVGGYPGPEPWEARLAQPHRRLPEVVVDAALPRPCDERVSLGEVMRRLRRYVIAGLRVPEITDHDAAHRTLLDATDVRLLRGPGNLFGLLPAGLLRRDVIGVLRYFSTEAGLPMREGLTRARRFAEAGFVLEVPDGADASPADVVATAEELAVLSWHPRFHDPADEIVGSPPEQEVYDDVLRRYAFLGWPAEGPVAATRPVAADPVPGKPDTAGRWTEERTKECTESLGIRAYTSHEMLSRRQLARAAGMLSLSPAEVVDRFAPFLESRALSVPDLGELAYRTFTRLDSDLLGAALDRGADGRWLPDPTACPATLLETAQAVVRAQANEMLVAERLTVLAESGLVDDRAPALVPQWRAVSTADWDLLLGGRHHDFWALDVFETGVRMRRYDIRRAVRVRAVRDGLDVSFALLAAASARTSLASAVDRLIRLGPLVGLDVSALERERPTLPSDLRPSGADLMGCWTAGNREAGDTVVWLHAPHPALLVAHARDTDGTLGESIATLVRYERFGATWREPDDTVPWRDHRPTEHDSALFRPDLVGDGPVGPLSLMRVAARFGWTPARAWERLELYRPFGLELLLPKPDLHTVPVWQDLILLTERYTGQAPALSGEVTADRIAVTARELGQTTRWVYDRLALYASLFDLVLPSAPPAAAAPSPAAEPWRGDATP